jgi:sugar transferase EpsL
MPSIYSRAGKRALDIAVSLGILILLSPFLLIIALAVRSTMGKGILFRQERPGLRRKPFIINKFRTMCESRDENGELAPDQVRLTGFGEFLRRTSLDELPELINVLNGDMSLVGPRPLLMEYLARYTPVQARRMEVKPGITGWAQVNGRNAIDWETKFKYDVWYVDHLTFGLDMRILGLTLMKVFNKEGISYKGHATMPGFKGTGG